MVLYPFSYLYGLMALPFGAEAAKMAEQEIAGVGYRPFGKEGQEASGLIAKGMEAFLTPTRKATEKVEKISPRAAYLTKVGGEVLQFALTGGIGKGVVNKTRAYRAINKAKKQGVKVMELIRKRRAEIDKAVLDSEIFVKQFEKDLTPKELEALPFIRQKIKDPEVLKKIGREDLIPIIEKPSTKLLESSEKIGKYYDEAHQYLKENWGEDLGFIENYVTQIWDIPKNRRAEVVNYFATKNPFTKKRTIPTLEDGINLGLKPKTINIAELLRIYDQYKIKTVHNMRFAKDLKNLVDEGGNPLMMRIDKAPEGWVTIEHPALSRAMFAGKTKKDGVILSKVPVKVHPEIAAEVKIIFDKPFSHAAISAYETINAFTKKTMLTLSLFHHFALTESAFSTGIGLKAISLWNPYKIYKAVKNKDFEIYKQMPLAKDSIDHGVTYGALADVQRSRVENSLIWLERELKDVPIAGKGAKGLRTANQLWDTALWDYYHNTLKLYAYEANTVNALKSAKKTMGKDLTLQEVTDVKRTMASFVNDSFGGQNWELSKVMGNPKMRQMAHWLFLAPDWTFSTLKQATAPMRGVQLQATNKIAGTALTKRAGLFWAKAVLYFNIIAQSVNYYNTKKTYGEGRFTWDNAPGHELNMFAGHNEDGTERYIRMGKQFREVMGLAMNPVRYLGAKLAPALRESIRQITAHGPGSGFPTEWAEEDEFWKTLAERAKSLAEMPLPFSLRPYIKDKPTMFMFSLPASKGMTNYGAVRLFKEAFKEQSPKKAKHIYISALQNNLDAESLFRSAKQAVKADMTYDDRRLAKDILKELDQLNDEAKKDAIKVYVQKGIITQNVMKQLEKLLISKGKVKEYQKLLGIEIK
jgi:hypothetical protein